MSISDRLDEIEDDIHNAFRLPKTPAVALVAEERAPDMLAALRAVLDLHKPEKFMDSEEICSGCDIGTLDPPAWPCATYRAIATALGDEYRAPMSEQPATTSRVKAGFCGSPASPMFPILAERFDLWLAEVQAEAWEKAVYHLEPFIGSQKRREAMADNPYRQEADQ